MLNSAPEAVQADPFSISTPLLSFCPLLFVGRRSWNFIWLGSNGAICSINPDSQTTRWSKTCFFCCLFNATSEESRWEDEDWQRVLLIFSPVFHLTFPQRTQICHELQTSWVLPYILGTLRCLLDKETNVGFDSKCADLWKTLISLCASACLLWALG